MSRRESELIDFVVVPLIGAEGVSVVRLGALRRSLRFRLHFRRHLHTTRRMVGLAVLVDTIVRRF